MYVKHIALHLKLTTIAMALEKVLSKRQIMHQPDKILALNCSKECHEEISSSQTKETGKQMKKLTALYGRISGCSTDCCFKVEEKSFFAHKLLLSSKSKFFRNMLTRDFIENRMENSLIGVTASIFELILFYIYFYEEFNALCHEDLTINQWVSLFRYADYFMINGLQIVCAEKIAPLITKENMINLLQLSIDLNSSSLETSCLKYIFEK
jgi:hypothetical protein